MGPTLRPKHPLHPKVMRLLMLVLKVRKVKKYPPGVTPPTPWELGSTTSKSEQSAERGASQTLDPMEVFPQKRGPRKATRRSPLKKLQKNKFFAHKTSRHKRPSKNLLSLKKF